VKIICEQKGFGMYSTYLHESFQKYSHNYSLTSELGDFTKYVVSFCVPQVYFSNIDDNNCDFLFYKFITDCIKSFANKVLNNLPKIIDSRSEQNVREFQNSLIDIMIVERSNIFDSFVKNTYNTDTVDKTKFERLYAATEKCIEEKIHLEHMLKNVQKQLKSAQSLLTAYKSRIDILESKLNLNINTVEPIFEEKKVEEVGSEIEEVEDKTEGKTEDNADDDDDKGKVEDKTEGKVEDKEADNEASEVDETSEADEDTDDEVKEEEKSTIVTDEKQPTIEVQKEKINKLLSNSED
jgi:hypothetical protein